LITKRYYNWKLKRRLSNVKWKELRVDGAVKMAEKKKNSFNWLRRQNRGMF